MQTASRLQPTMASRLQPIGSCLGPSWPRRQPPLAPQVVQLPPLVMFRQPQQSLVLVLRCRHRHFSEHRGYQKDSSQLESQALEPLQRPQEAPAEFLQPRHSVRLVLSPAADTRPLTTYQERFWAMQGAAWTSACEKVG